MRNGVIIANMTLNAPFMKETPVSDGFQEAFVFFLAAASHSAHTTSPATIEYCTKDS
jgi:hypothetical protein